MMAWFERSAGDQDTHWGTVARGQGNTVCEISFRRAWGAGPLGQPDLISLCPECVGRGERGRLWALGASTSDGGGVTLLVVEELDESWTFHGPGGGVVLPKDKAVALAESILRRAHPQGDEADR